MDRRGLMGGLAAAMAVHGAAAAAPLPLLRPEKLGIGAAGLHGAAQLVADVRALGATWYYTWSPVPSELVAGGWRLGQGAAAPAYGGVRLAPGAQASLDITVAGRQAMTMTLESAAGSGRLTAVFLNAQTYPLWSFAEDVAAGQVSWPVATPAGARMLRLTLMGGRRGLSVLDARLRTRTLARSFGGARMAAFVPMIWGLKNIRAIGDFGEEVRGAPVLGFNEPDNTDQSALSVTQAVALWPRLLATGCRAGSPAPTTPGALGGGSWLGQFMAAARAQGLRVDFICLHYYSADTDVAAFRSFLEAAYRQYGRPIWVTEWGLADWNDAGRVSAADQAAFFAAGARMMDGLPFVERHAWFGSYDGMDGYYMNSGLIGPDGRPTPVGRQFVAAAGV